MKLPNKENAYIPISKLTAYLLSDIHPLGRSKAKYLKSIGFDETNIELLEQILLFIAQTEDIKDVIPSPYGVKYVIDGNVNAPYGDDVLMRTIWIIDNNTNGPRFVTAYPL